MANTVALPALVPGTEPTTGRGGQMPSAPLIALRVIVTLTGTYATGGEDFNPAALLQSLAGYDKAPDILTVLTPTKAGLVLAWDRATNKILIFEAGADGTPLDEFANGADHVTPLGGSFEAVILAQ